MEGNILIHLSRLYLERILLNSPPLYHGSLLAFSYTLSLSLLRAGSLGCILLLIQLVHFVLLFHMDTKQNENKRKGERKKERIVGVRKKINLNVSGCIISVYASIRLQSAL